MSTRKIYDASEKILTGDNFPTILFKEKQYTVDNRMSNYKKIQKAMAENEDDSILIELALGKEAAKEIEKMDLKVPEYKQLIVYISAAIEEIEVEEVEARFQK